MYLLQIQQLGRGTNMIASHIQKAAHLHMLVPRAAGQLALGLQLSELGGVVGICKAHVAGRLWTRERWFSTVLHALGRGARCSVEA